jgi:hypothetical protein
MGYNISEWTQTNEIVIVGDILPSGDVHNRNVHKQNKQNEKSIIFIIEVPHPIPLLFDKV